MSTSEFDPNSIRQKLPHSGDLPVEQGGERPTQEFDNTPLDEAVRQGYVQVPEAVPSHLTDEEQALIERHRAKKTAEAKPEKSHAKAIAASVVGALAIGGGVLGFKAMSSDDKEPLRDPERPVATAPTNPGEVVPTPSIDAAKVYSEMLSTGTSYHDHIAKHPGDAEALTKYIVSEVEVPSEQWAALPLADRASRTAAYVQVGTEKCFNDGIIGPDVLTAQANLDAVKWSPYVTKDILSSAAKGNVNDLRKVETIRQMYECSIGSADNGSGYSQQIKDNLTAPSAGFFTQPDNAVVYRSDYAESGVQSSLNVGAIDNYGGTVQSFPTPDKADFPFDGVTIDAPSPAWHRPPMIDYGNYMTLPVETKDGKFIPVYGFTEEPTS